MQRLYGTQIEELGPELTYFAMDSFQCQSLESSEYFENNPDPRYWPYPPSGHIPGGNFTSGTIISPESFPPWVEQWPDCAPPSPQSSELSSSGRAPSSHTSYNENDGGDSATQDLSPRSPVYLSRTQSPPYNVQGPELMQCDPLFDLRTSFEPMAPVASLHGGSSLSISEHLVCPEGCRNKKNEQRTFRRPYELARHMDLHRCPHSECKDLYFTDAKEKKEHVKGHSEFGMGWRCGKCLLDGVTPKPLSRFEKVRNHYRDTHKISSDLDFSEFQCKQGLCFLSELCGGIFFPSLSDLDKHTMQCHGTSPGRSSSRLIHSKPLKESVGVGNISKRRLEHDSEYDAKRWKTGSTLPQQDVVSSQMLNSSPSTITPRSARHHIETLEDKLELSIIDLQALTKQQKWKTVLDDLKSLHISSTFDSKKGEIILRGTCSAAELEQGKIQLADLINQSKPICFQEKDHLVYSKPTITSQQQVSVHPQCAIYALDPKEDAEVILLWNTKLLPEFPQIVEEASIEGTYSVALVRQDGPNGPQPIIRFRSSGNQGDTSRQIVRESVEEICESNSQPKLQVQFTKGTLVRLAGANSTVSIVDDPSIDEKFPHERRFWGRPGMGASLGRSQCPHVSATLGGYISIGGKIHILSVDHFLSLCSCQNSNKLRSPSISDVFDARQEIRKKLNELGLKISRSAPDEVPLGQVEDILFPSWEINEEMEQYRRFQDELHDNDDFALGIIRGRCGATTPIRRLTLDPRYPGTYHHMDWSVSEVTVKHREGKNLFRHGRIAKPGLEDLANEIMTPEGCGEPCTTIGDAIDGEAVYYVGTTSGLREGTINAALTQWRDEHGEISHEWIIVVPDCEQLKSSDFEGDSGAWVFNNSNVLLGLLWGWDNANLLFTPIKDVFADIAQHMNRDIKLPEYSSGSRSERSGSLLCRRSFSATRESTPECIEPEDLIEPVPVRTGLLSPINIPQSRFRRGSSASLISINSNSSLPSLFSSASSLYDEPILPLSLPQSPSPIMINGLSIRTKSGISSDSSDAEWVHIRHEEISNKNKTQDQQVADMKHKVCERIVT